MENERDGDQIFVARAQAGEREAFDTLVAKYHRRLRRLVLHIVRDPVAADDVVQETFIKAFRAMRRFRGDSAFYTWLCRIGINTAKNFIMRQRRCSRFSMPADAENALGFNEAESVTDVRSPESILASKQIVYLINAAMESLPLELRTAIYLHEIDGLSYKEIAEEMNCPIGTVRSRIFRARETIIKRVEPKLDFFE